MIGTTKRLDLGNFSLGQRADAALRDDGIFSLRRMVNYDIIYDTGRLKVRYGYERWNSIELPAVCTQLYQFIDLEGNEHFLGILDTSEIEDGVGFDQWYVVKEDADAVVLRAQGATARKAIITYGKRCFFATNQAFWWTDHDLIIGGDPKSDRVGILDPTYAPVAEAVTGEGNIVGAVYDGEGDPGDAWDINATSRQKASAQFQVSATQTVGHINLMWLWYDTGSHTGEFRVGIYQDDEGAIGDLVDEYNSVSTWKSIKQGDQATFTEHTVEFQGKFELEPSTDYWLVIEGSTNYMANYIATGPAYFFIGFGYVTVADGALAWNGSAWTAITKKVAFTIGGIADDDSYFTYVYTYYNSTYGSESRPSEPSERISRNTFVQNAIEITFTASTYDQVDKVRLYRRNIGTDPDVAESTITALYYLVQEFSESVTSIRDISSGGDLGGVLQTEDHYTYDFYDLDPGSERPAALLPYTIIEWKGRIWFAEEDGNSLYFSKVLEQDGATGLTGDNIPDFFPLENRLEMPVPSGIIGLGKLPGNILAVYFQDESVWTVQGGDQPLNPPPDFSYRELLPNNGLFAVGTLGSVAGGNIFLSREGLYRMSLVATEYLSETNQTILDAIDSPQLANSVLTVNGNEIWLLIDTDSDDDLDTILILDLQRDLPTRQLRDRAWREYKYDVTLNDIVVRKQGDTYRGVMAADAENNYILSLNTGYLDNLFPIPVEGETHDLEVPGLVGVTGVSIRANYIDVVSSYDITITDGVDEPRRFSIMPSAQDDLRGHRAGVRVIRPNFVRVKWESSHVRRDEIRGITIDYIIEGVE
jgi:hypothetical protein